MTEEARSPVRAQPRPGLALRVIRVVTTSGHEVVEESVYCPRREASLPLATCMGCEAFQGVKLCARGQSELECGAAAEALPPASARRTPVSTVMTRQVVAVHQEARASAVRAVLLERSAGQVVVVDDATTPIGTVAAKNLLRRWPLRGEAPRARDWMTPSRTAVPEGTSISQASAIMAQEDLKLLPVVSERGALVGVVTALDVLTWLARSEGYLVAK